jgi:hypothetical protein
MLNHELSILLNIIVYLECRKLVLIHLKWFRVYLQVHACKSSVYSIHGVSFISVHLRSKKFINILLSLYSCSSHLKTTSNFSSYFIIATNLLKDKPCMLLQLTAIFDIAKAWPAFHLNISKCILISCALQSQYASIQCHFVRVSCSWPSLSCIVINMISCIPSKSNASGITLNMKYGINQWLVLDKIHWHIQNTKNSE